MHIPVLLILIWLLLPGFSFGTTGTVIRVPFDRVYIHVVGTSTNVDGVPVHLICVSNGTDVAIGVPDIKWGTGTIERLLWCAIDMRIRERWEQVVAVDPTYRSISRNEAIVRLDPKKSHCFQIPRYRFPLPWRIGIDCFAWREIEDLTTMFNRNVTESAVWSGEQKASATFCTGTVPTEKAQRLLCEDYPSFMMRLYSGTNVASEPP